LSILTGATLHSECSNGPLEKNKINICGKVKRVLVTSKFSTITSANFNSENIEERKNILRSELSDPTLSHSESVFLKERLAKLSNGVATIKVGGITEVEAKERMYRIEDAVNATRTAFEAGVLPGGGIALLSLSNKLEKNLFDEIYHPTVEAIKKACEAPLRQIVSNTGLIPDLVIEKYKEKIYSSKDDKLIGYDARNFCFDNMFESGIIDPLNVTKAALSNATSVANIFISLDSVLL
jgi:chaperonin GroEL